MTVVREVPRTLDALLVALCAEARILPAITPLNAKSERERLIASLLRGEMPIPAWQYANRPVSRRAYDFLKEARELTAEVELSELYQSRLDELELDLAILHAIPEGRHVRALSARRFGTGAETLPTESGIVETRAVARHILDTVADEPDTSFVAADGDGDRVTASSLVRAVAHAANLPVEVRVEPRLAAAAATGDRSIFLADRAFGAREAVRVAVHEVLAHLTAAANGRTQPLRIVELGTANSFADQEGVALYFEWKSGYFDGHRMRVLAARVIACDRLHAGASFGDVARELVREESFSAADAVAIAERAFRGGGVARDAGYLRGLVRVRHAVESNQATLDELRMGRVGLADLPCLREAQRKGVVRTPSFTPGLQVLSSCYLPAPSFVLNFSLTPAGTSFDTSPPNLAASLTRFELT